MENLYFTNYKGIVQNIASLFYDESSKDVTFMFEKSNKTVKAHKIILKAASPVFKSMFCGSFAEKIEMKIDDIRPEVFKLFLSGIYLNDIHAQVKSYQQAEIYADLYDAAVKFDIKDIRELSRKFMIDNCSYRNTHLLLQRAKLLNLPDLEAKCKNCFQENAYLVLARHINRNLCDGYFHEFFDLNNIPVKTEFDLYMALQAMVHNGVLLDYKKCLSKIRFLTMEMTDILNCELLSADDIRAVFSNIEAKKLQKAPKFPMPAHLSRENSPRISSNVNKNNRRYFWITIMLLCDNYERYFADFCKHMEILRESEAKTRHWIKQGRKEVNLVNREGSIPYSVVQKVIKNIFSYQ